MKKRFNLVFILLAIIMLGTIYGCKSEVVEPNKLIKVANIYKDRDNFIFEPNLDASILSEGKYVIALPEEKRTELFRQVDNLNAAKNKKELKSQYDKLDKLLKEIKAKRKKGTKLVNQFFISITEKAKPYVKILNYAFKSDNIILQDADKPLEVKIAPRIGKEITSAFYNKITKIKDPVSKKIDITKTKENLTISDNDLYNIPINSDIELDVITTNKRDLCKLNIINSAMSNRIKISKLSNDNMETELNLENTNKLTYNTTLKLKATSIENGYKGIFYINSVRHDLDLNNELLYRITKDVLVELKVVPIYTITLMNEKSDYNVSFEENTDAKFNKDTNTIISSGNNLISLTFQIKEKYEIKNLAITPIGEQADGTYREVLTSSNIEFFNPDTNKAIDLLKSQYQFFDLTNELETAKSYNRKYKLVFKVLGNTKINFKLDIIKFNLKLTKDTSNNNTLDILENTSKYFTTNVASLENIDALSVVKFNFKPVSNDKIRILYVGSTPYKVGDTFELVLKDNIEIKYQIKNTYKVKVFPGQEDKFTFPVEDITKPIEEGVHVTFTIKNSDISVDLSDKIKINGKKGLVKKIPHTNQYSFILTEDSTIQIDS